MGCIKEEMRVRMNNNIEKYLEVMKDKEGYSKWNFTPDDDGPMVQTGYEDVYDELEKYTYEEYMKDVPEGHSGFEADDTPNQRKLQKEIIEIYRRKNIFPIPYYNYNGILNEIQKVINTEIEFDGDVISGGAGVGTGLCNFLFPNLYDTVSAKDLTKHKAGAESARKKFYNDDFLKKAIRVAIQYGKSTPQPSSIYSGLGMVGSMPSNFKPLIARAIYDRFTEVGDTVFDSSSGFGGRLLGALSSKKNLRYIGCDPNSETQKHLHELGGYIEEVTGRENSFELFEKGSEEFCYGDNTIDFAFSSPPYFDLELYSVEDTQSSMKYPTLESWLEGFVRGTIKNLYRMLKPGKFYCVNIADFTSPSGGICHFVDEWTRISEEEGFERMPNLYLGIPARAGSLEKKLGEMKKENILVFKSKKSFFDF